MTGDILDFFSEGSWSVAEGRSTPARWFEGIAPVYMKINFEGYRYRIRRRGPPPLMETGAWFFTPFCLRRYAGPTRRFFHPESATRRGAPGAERRCGFPAHPPSRPAVFREIIGFPGAGL